MVRCADKSRCRCQPGSSEGTDRKGVQLRTPQRQAKEGVTEWVWDTPALFHSGGDQWGADPGKGGRFWHPQTAQGHAPRGH